MRVGVGLPATIPGTPGSLLIEWARRAEAGPFSSLSSLDRLLYDNYEPLTALAAAAAVTERIALAATIVIAPLRSTATLAKQAATLDALSGGRLVLGVGLGAREDDYEIAGVPLRGRGRRLGDQLAELRRLWDVTAMGPSARRSTGPRLLVGGGGGLAAARMARYADGYVHSGGPARAFARAAAEARAAWEDAGRPGAPELWGMAYFQLGDRAHEGSSYLLDYYAFTGPFAERIAAGLLTEPDDIHQFLRDYRDAGCDELILFPTVPRLDQLDRLTEVVGG